VSPDSVDQFGEPEFGVADNPDGRRQIAPDFGRIDVELNHDPIAAARPERVRGLIEASSDRQDNVGGADEIGHRYRVCREVATIRKGAPPVAREEDWCLEGFRKYR